MDKNWNSVYNHVFIPAIIQLKAAQYQMMEIVNTREETYLQIGTI